MTGGKAFLLFWLTVQWLALGPLAAALSYFLVFSDAHGLPGGSSALCLVILGLATAGYVTSLRILLGSRESA